MAQGSGLAFLYELLFFGALIMSLHELLWKPAHVLVPVCCSAPARMQVLCRRGAPAAEDSAAAAAAAGGPAGVQGKPEKKESGAERGAAKDGSKQGGEAQPGGGDAEQQGAQAAEQQQPEAVPQKVQLGEKLKVLLQVRGIEETRFQSSVHHLMGGCLLKLEGGV
eukprot:1152579-Pelagomonas_calceolata.AAC.14